MIGHKFIGFINLGTYVSTLRIGDSDRFHGVPLFSVKHWIGALEVLLRPLETIMHCKPGQLGAGVLFDINKEQVIDRRRSEFGLGDHYYCGFIISGVATSETRRLEKAVEDFHSSLGIDAWLSALSRCGLESEAELKAEEKQLVIYTDSEQHKINISYPEVYDMVEEPRKDSWRYLECTNNNWNDVVDLVCNSINKFIELALAKTKLCISENYINAFNPLRDEAYPDAEERYSFRVIDSLSTGQFGLIVGEEGIGKTMLSLEIGLEVSNQNEQYATLSKLLEVHRPGAVIGVFQEDSKKDIGSRAKNIGKRLGIEFAPHLGVVTHEFFDSALTPAARKEAIQAYLKEALAFKGAPGWKDLSLIIVDPIGLLIEGDESSAEPMKILCDYLSMIAREYNCAVLGIHHPTKSAKLKPYGPGGTLDLNAAAGHPVLTRCARWVLNISRAKKDAIKLKVTKSNNSELTGDIHQLVKVNERGETYKSGDNFAGFAIDNNEGDTKSSLEKIYEALSCIDLSMHTKTKVIADICESTGYSRNKVREAVEQLEDAGRIVSNRTVKGIQLALVSSE